jgi:hypothetical protein
MPRLVRRREATIPRVTADTYIESTTSEISLSQSSERVATP